MLLSSTLATSSSPGYALLDSGDNEKLERYGDITVRRPDPQALWHKHLSQKIWNAADAVFSTTAKNVGWVYAQKIPERWQIDLSNLKFWIRPTSFKHTGLFPEQAPNWEWMSVKISAQRGSALGGTNPVRVLNLFGYTGGATLACAAAGAEVVHVDGSKVAIGWGRDNAALSGLSDKPIRWILDDAVKFVEREVKRGRQYDGIILDPPAFGHGPNKELWKIEEHLLPLLALCKNVLSPTPLFFLLNGYASGYSAIAYGNNLADLMKSFEGSMEIGELTIQEETGGRLLPCGIFARWSAEKQQCLRTFPLL